MAPHNRSKASETQVPAVGENPAERKRVLNVLAQRRYRERRKERVKQLEERIKSTNLVDDLTEPTLPQAGRDGVMLGATMPLQTANTPPSTKFPQPLSPDLSFPQTDQFSFSESDPALFMLNPFDGWDTSVLFPTPLITPSPSGNSLSSDSPDTASSNNVAESAAAPLGFPDETHLPVLELNLMRGAMTIARRLNVEISIWSLEANSPFNDLGGTMPNYGHLPVNLQPSLAQRHHPHHPSLDIFPWPSVRDKLIMVFSQPIEFRPPAAASPTALLDFIYDIEDPAEGIRIWGDDPCSENNWELGEKVFNRWWWVFDSQIVAQSNRMREQRGATLLGRARTDRGHVVGEVS